MELLEEGECKVVTVESLQLRGVKEHSEVTGSFLGKFRVQLKSCEGNRRLIIKFVPEGATIGECRETLLVIKGNEGSIRRRRELGFICGDLRRDHIRTKESCWETFLRMWEESRSTTDHVRTWNHSNQRACALTLLRLCRHDLIILVFVGIVNRYLWVLYIGRKFSRVFWYMAFGTMKIPYIFLGATGGGDSFNDSGQ
jgi:hypothetical protein